MGGIVRLFDGTSVDSDSEAWRHECEARGILALDGVETRRAWLAEIEAKRGQAAVERLRATMLAIHGAERSGTVKATP